MRNLPSSKTTSVPTNEVRNNFDRNPGIRLPWGGPPPLEIALWQMDNSQSQCVCVSYACIWKNWGKDSSTCITCGVSWGGQHRGSLSALRPRESWCRWRRRRCAAIELQRPRGRALHTHIVLTIVSVYTSIHDGNDAIFRDTPSVGVQYFGVECDARTN